MNFRLRLIVALAAISLFTWAAPAQMQVALPIYNPPPASSSPRGFTKVGTKAFFFATTLNEGGELWVTDGTAAGTKLVKDITPGSASSSLSSLAEFKGYLYFTVGKDLWRSNGTAAGTVIVKTLDAYGLRLYSAGTLLYMASGDYSNGQLWVSDGTAARTFRVRSFWREIESPFAFNGKLFFTTSEDSLLGKQMWVSDGTLFGTRVLSAGSACPMTGCEGRTTFFRVGPKVLFVVRTSYYEPGDLWTTDGTEAGTQLIRQKSGGLLARSDAVAYLASGGTLTRTNGTSAGTSVVKQLSTGIAAGGAAMVGNTLFFRVGEYSWNARELWKSDGTAAGTTLVITAQTGPDAGEGATATRFLFMNSDTATGHEPWVSDGTSAGTKLLKDLALGPTGSWPSGFFGMGNYMLFAAEVENEGRELWRTDGTAVGTYRLLNIAPEQITGAISGVVRDATTAAPIAGASVVVYDAYSRLLVTVTSGSDGTYRIDKLTTDGYYLRATTPTRVPQVYPNLDCNGCWPGGRQLVRVTAGMETTGVDFPLSLGGVITGKVTHNGIAVPETAVTLYDSNHRHASSVRTSADGTYTTSFGLVPGTYYAVATPPWSSLAVGQAYGGAICASDPWQCVASAKPVTATAGKTTAAINFALGSRPRISGRVTTALGQPIAALTVRVYSASGYETGMPTLTNAAGEYITQPMVAGEYFVAAMGAEKQYVSQVYHNQNCPSVCDPATGRRIAVDYNVPATGINFALHPKAGIIRGTVKDDVTGEAVKVQVTLYDTAGNEVNVDGNDSWDGDVDAAGHFELRNVKPGTYFLQTGTRLYNGIDCASCDVTKGTPIVVASIDSIVNLTIAYPHIAKLSGTLTSSDTGLPIPYALVAWRRASDGYWIQSTSTNSEGKWTLVEPNAPAYLVFSSDLHLPEAWNNQPLTCESCAIPSGAIVFDPATTTDRADLNATLTSRPSIKGNLKDQDGNPLNGSVTFYSSTGGYAGHVSYISGAYTWRPAAPGTYFAVAEVAVRNSYVRQLYAGKDCSASCTPTSGTAIAAAAGATVSGIDFTFNATQVMTGITGIVTDDAGKPLAGVIVDIASGDFAYRYWSELGRTDANGRYSISLSAGASYKLRARRPQSASYTQIYGGISCVSQSECADSSSGTAVVVPSGAAATADIRMPTVTVTSIAPRLGPPSGGTRVTFTGVNFSSAFKVTFDGLPANIVSITATQMVVVSPIGSVGSAHVRFFGGDIIASVTDAFTYVSTAAGDINGDFRGDIFWRNASTGANDAWLMDGRFNVAARTYDPYAAEWQVQTLADFNGDGFADVFWRNTSTGANKVWFMRNALPQYVTVSSMALAWRIVGSGDFDLDGKADLLWRNDGTGANIVWFSTGTAFRGVATSSAVAPWQPAAVGDFNGDGRADVLWRNTTTLEVAVWLMNGATRTHRALATVSSGWRVAATGDTDGDGLADVLWRKDATGEHSLWLMNVGSPYFVARPLARTTTAWSPIGMADVTGDGRADIVLRNSSTGQPSVWSMNGSTRISAFSLPTRDLSWKPYLAH